MTAGEAHNEQMITSVHVLSAGRRTCCRYWKRQSLFDRFAKLPNQMSTLLARDVLWLLGYAKSR